MIRSNMEEPWKFDLVIQRRQELIGLAWLLIIWKTWVWCHVCIEQDLIAYVFPKFARNGPFMVLKIWPSACKGLALTWMVLIRMMAAIRRSAREAVRVINTAQPLLTYFRWCQRRAGQLLYHNTTVLWEAGRCALEKTYFSMALGLDSLYKGKVTDHSGSPHHHGKLEDAEQVVPNNPTCGDVVSFCLWSLMPKIGLKILASCEFAVRQRLGQRYDDGCGAGKHKKIALELAEVFAYGSGQGRQSPERIGWWSLFTGSQIPSGLSVRPGLECLKLIEEDKKQECERKYVRRENQNHDLGEYAIMMMFEPVSSMKGLNEAVIRSCSQDEPEWDDFCLSNPGLRLRREMLRWKLRVRDLSGN